MESGSGQVTQKSSKQVSSYDVTRDRPTNDRVRQADAQNTTLVRCIAENALAWVHAPDMSDIPNEEDAESPVQRTLLDREGQPDVRLERNVLSHDSAGVITDHELHDRTVREPLAAEKASRYTTPGVRQEDEGARLKALSPEPGLSTVYVQDAAKYLSTLRGNQSYYSAHRDDGMPGLEDAEQAAITASRKYQPVQEWAKKLLETGQSNHHCYNTSQTQIRTQGQRDDEALRSTRGIINNANEIPMDDSSGFAEPTSIERQRKTALNSKVCSTQAHQYESANQGLVPDESSLCKLLDILKQTLGPHGANRTNPAIFSTFWDPMNSCL